MLGLNPRQLRTAFKLLLTLDVIGCIIAFNVANYLRTGEWLWFSEIEIWMMTGAVVASFYVLDAYRIAVETTKLILATRVLVAVVVVGVVLAAVTYLMGPTGLDPIYWRSVLPVAMGLITFWAIGHRLGFSEWLVRAVSKTQWLCIGTGNTAKQVVEDYLRAPGIGRMYTFGEFNSDAVFGKSEQRLVQIEDFDSVSSNDWTGIILANDEYLDPALTTALMHARLRGIQIYSVDTFYEQTWAKVPLFYLQDHWFTLASGFSLLHENVQLRIKRLLDLLLAGILLLALLPVALLMAIAIRLDSEGPVLYAQRRVGHNGTVFTLYKFRTMFNNAEENGAQWAKEDDERVTRIGRWLRFSRFDEWPQVWNVLQGSMSFVGPRPERPEFTTELEKKIPYYELRHLVKPGITGWAQIMRPYGSSIEDALEKLEYDLYYIKNYSLILDMLIILKTIRVVLLGKGR